MQSARPQEGARAARGAHASPPCPDRSGAFGPSRTHAPTHSRNLRRRPAPDACQRHWSTPPSCYPLALPCSRWNAYLPS
jgi:hypothetical protein